jgi:hypothetical protein
MHGNNTRNSLCSYLYLKLATSHVFLFIFYLFSSTKSENRRAEQFLQEWRGMCVCVGTSGRGEMVGKGAGG